VIAKRIIPFFLVSGARLVKGTKFSNFVDVGDPTSQAMVYDAQGADEIAIVDIDAAAQKRTIEPAVITEMITKCRLPIAAGGGIKDIHDARKCFHAGADKIIVNTNAILRPRLIAELADEFGAQSVVVSIDVKRNDKGDFDIYINSGTKKADIDLVSHVQQVSAHGAGEIIVTSIDKEGTLSGFECDLYKRLQPLVRVPLIASGGAGSYDDIVALFETCDCDAAALGKMLFLRDYDIVRIKSYLKGRKVLVREA